MALSNFPNGASSFGIPLLGGSVPTSSGVYFFVDATNGNDGASGLDSTQPLASITKALDRAVSGRGDVILVAPGSYDENLSITKDYITLMGLWPSGFARPDVVPSTGMALSVHAQGFVTIHMRYVGTGIGGIALQQSGNGFLHYDCVIESTSNHGIRLFPDKDDDHFTASEGKIIDCLIRDVAGSGISFENPGPGVMGGVGPTDIVVDGCVFYGNGTDIDDVDTAGSNDTTFFRSTIKNCNFLTKDKAVYIDLSAGGNNTGLISNCYFANKTAPMAATQIALDANAIVVSGCYQAAGLINGTTL